MSEKDIGMVVGGMLVLFQVQAWAQTAGLQNQQAVQKTQAFLRNSAERSQFIQQNPAAAKTDQDVQQLLGSKQNADGAYDLSADILGSLAAQTQGDSAKMQQLLEQAQKNPEAFAASLSSEQQAKLRSLASQIEAKKTPIKNP